MFIYNTNICGIFTPKTNMRLTVNMCGVEGKRRLCDLNVTSSSPALATRHSLSARILHRAPPPPRL